MPPSTRKEQQLDQMAMIVHELKQFLKELHGGTPSFEPTSADPSSRVGVLEDFPMVACLKAAQDIDPAVGTAERLLRALYPSPDLEIPTVARACARRAASALEQDGPEGFVLTPATIAAAIIERNFPLGRLSSSDIERCSQWPPLDSFPVSFRGDGFQEKLRTAWDALVNLYVVEDKREPDDNVWTPHPETKRRSDKNKVLLCGDLLTINHINSLKVGAAEQLANVSDGAPREEVVAKKCAHALLQTFFLVFGYLHWQMHQAGAGLTADFEMGGRQLAEAASHFNIQPDKTGQNFRAKRQLAITRAQAAVNAALTEFGASDYLPSRDELVDRRSGRIKLGTYIVGLQKFLEKAGVVQRLVPMSRLSGRGAFGAEAAPDLTPELLDGARAEFYFKNVSL